MVSGTIVVSNHTGQTFNLTQGCAPGWTVGLQSATIPFTPAETLPCESAPFLLNPGVTRLPFELQVRYEGCSTNPSNASVNVPPCIGTEPPPLPPGPYQAVLVSDTEALHADPVNVEVVAASGVG